MSKISRRSFLADGAAAFGAMAICGCSKPFGKPGAYSISVLGDTHFDTSPLSHYHGKWIPRDEQDWKDRQGEFKRNLDMWTTGRVPRLVDAAAKVRRTDTAYLFHMGDLIQGDCTDFDIYRQYFRDAEAVCTKGFGDIPFLVACGNHDIRGGGERAFDAYALPLAEKLVGRPVASANFMLRHGSDAYIFLDFMRPDPLKTDRLFAESEDARYTFVCMHGPVAASDTWGSYWFTFGEPEFTDYRRDFFRRLLKRRAIVLCGHLHKTQIRRWVTLEGELVEFCANSVWRRSVDVPKVLYDRPAQFGEYVRKYPPRMNEDYDGRRQTRTKEEIFALLDEYRAGLVEYKMMGAAGHYMLHVSDKGVSIDFYACDSITPLESFRLVGDMT